MQRFFLILCGVFVFSFPSASHAGILEFLFPSLREEEYDPSKEMVAEFAAGQGAVGRPRRALTSLVISSIRQAAINIFSFYVIKRF